jgi:hypothetical protein
MDPAIVADEDDLEKCIRADLPYLFFSNHPGWPWETIWGKVSDCNG